MHYHALNNAKSEMAILVGAKTKNQHEGKVQITITRYACQLMDWDNLAGGFKIIGDALVRQKVIKDDKPEVVVFFNTQQIKVATRKEERTMILIEDI